MFAWFQQVDHIPQSETAVLVAVQQQYFSVGILPIPTPNDTAIVDLVLISLFYLIMVGEYTQNKESPIIVLFSL